MPENEKSPQANARGYGLFGSLKDALVAASREDQPPAAMKALAAPEERAPNRVPAIAIAHSPPALPAAEARAAKSVEKQMEASMASGAIDKKTDESDSVQASVPSAEEAARAVRGSVTLKPLERHVEFNDPPTTRVFRKSADVKVKDQPLDRSSDNKARESTEQPRTQLVRGRQRLVRNDFAQDPVVAWLVVVGGPGLGAYRPVFEGNNTIGRAKTQRIPVDFGDDAISSEEQAYIRYDSTDRSFLFVPNLAKTNVVSVNDKRPTGAVELAHMDVITVGRTQLVFVPFCGPDFDWAELAEVKD